MQVNWSEEADFDLNEIVDFIAADNPVAAINLSELLFDTAEKIGSTPYMGRIGRVSGTRELVAHPNYILVYQLKTNEVLILRVLHSSRMYPCTPETRFPIGRRVFY